MIQHGNYSLGEIWEKLYEHYHVDGKYQLHMVIDDMVLLPGINFRSFCAKYPLQGTMVQHKIVVADIGGTNARFQVCTSQNFLISLMSNLVQAWSIDFECGDALDFEKVRIY